MPQPQTPLRSLQRNILIPTLTWATGTLVVPSNWRFVHKSKNFCFYCAVFIRPGACLMNAFCNVHPLRFRGTLWMSEEHPLSLVEQVTPIIDLMARTSSHFARLRDFVTLKFPPGFPVKIGTNQYILSSFFFSFYKISILKIFFFNLLRDSPVSCAECQDYIW